MKEMRGVPTFDLALSPMTRGAGVTTGAVFSVTKTGLPDGVSPTRASPVNNPLTLREATETIPERARQRGWPESGGLSCNVVEQLA
jgi:hypothetical protein